MSTKTNPKRGEVWVVELDPTKGSEMQKTRRSVIVSSDAVGVLPIKLIAPIRGWKEEFTNDIWNIKLEPSSTNGLTKTSTVDVLQLRGVDIQRFKNKVGCLTASEMEEIAASIAAVVEYM
ncbi:MAG: type II toxin-antitoxin system PemK/MazF family toxin [Melioribacteraceae bacterium]|nr:type II toxin-antitoxin system PemK/MazF family toxin [Melioribacteraceae bacterium]MCF8355010.1 type II toxin-antitoxin system PemK/MazF family toxin [Melioribacteraceae bacterium]MCF8394335.1 type II toxin-antitoxin system PemK/MazF family toxin [Melioribacteraceae bacterium]MCF8420014.1 type II toxin-antitoxin system PemK/MazF family toxin [Melioribacteraceae bacterium]